MSVFDIRSIIEALNRHDVKYVLVGALAAIAHGARLTTLDADLCIATDPENLERTAALLRDLDAKLIRVPARGLSAIDFDDWKTLRLDDPAKHHLFETRFGMIDILPHPLGPGGWGTLTSYDQLLPRAISLTAFGLHLQVAAFDDIVRSRLAAGRSQDIQVQPELQRIGALLMQGQKTDHGLENYAADLSLNAKE